MRPHEQMGLSSPKEARPELVRRLANDRSNLERAVQACYWMSDTAYRREGPVYIHNLAELSAPPVDHHHVHYRGHYTQHQVRCIQGDEVEAELPRKPAPWRFRFSRQYLPKEHTFHCLPKMRPPVLPLRDIYKFLKYRHQKHTIIDADGAWTLRKTQETCEAIIRLFEWESIAANRYKQKRQLTIAQQRREALQSKAPFRDLKNEKWWYYPEECDWMIAEALRCKKQLERMSRERNWREQPVAGLSLYPGELRDYLEIDGYVDSHREIGEQQEHLSVDADEMESWIEYRSLDVQPFENYARAALKAIGLSRKNGWPDRPNQRRRRWPNLLKSLLGIAVEHSS